MSIVIAVNCFWFAIIKGLSGFEEWRFAGSDVFGEVAIVTDCRFPKEVAWIRRRGSVVWWIERDGLAPVAAHSSEGAIGAADCDRTIRSFGTVQELSLEVERAWAELEASMEVERGAI